MLSSGAGFFSYMGMMGLSFMLPFLLEKTFVLEPLQTGRVLMVIPATTVFVSPLAGYLSDRMGQRPISTMGLVVSVVSILFLFQLDPQILQAGDIARLQHTRLGLRGVIQLGSQVGGCPEALQGAEGMRVLMDEFGGLPAEAGSAAQIARDAAERLRAVDRA